MPPRRQPDQSAPETDHSLKAGDRAPASAVGLHRVWKRAVDVVASEVAPVR